MARPLRIEFPGACYVVTARAMGRQKLFRGPEEVEDFVGRLPPLVDAFGAVFHGFCLLPNHYHLLVETPRGNLSRVLHRLNSGYTATVNARRGRTGPLLQSRYRSVLLEEDPWLLRLSAYIHLNPVRKRLAPDPWSYAGSSAVAYALRGREIPGLETATVLRRAGGREAYAALIAEGLKSPPPAPWREVWRQCVLGGEALRQKVLRGLEGIDTREIAGFSTEKAGLPLEEVVALVAESTGLSAEDILRGKFQRVLARKLAIYLARRFTGLTLRQIGEVFGVDYTTVHMVARRVEELKVEDAGVAGLVSGLEADLAARARELATVRDAEQPREANPPEPEKPVRKRAAKAEKKESGQLKLF
jgi:REP element-mobilizing transposase RayT